MTRINYSVLLEINMPEVEDRAKQLRLNHVFNVFNGLAPFYVKNVSLMPAYRTMGDFRMILARSRFKISSN